MKVRILLTGGGTGGHILPIVAVAQGIKYQFTQKGYIDELDFLFVGAIDEQNRKILESEGIKVKKIFTFKLRRYFSFKTILEFFTLPIGFLQCFWHLFWFMPDVIFSKGGYGSFPATVVGYLYFVPILIHESDVYPGLANRISAKFATRVAVSFSETFQYFPQSKTALTGNPIREGIDKGDAYSFKEKHSIKENLPILFVIGGSQGSQILNNVIYKVLPNLLKEVIVIHQCGINNVEKCKVMFDDLRLDESLKKRYYIFGFIGEDLKDIYALANLVVTRAGANVLAEIAKCGKPSIIIPLSSSAGNHQEKNAFFFAEKNAAIFMEEENLQGHLFYNTIISLIKDKDRLFLLSENVKKLAISEADKIIANGIIELVK